MTVERMHHLDLARGVAIILVFFCHMAQIAEFPFLIRSIEVWGQFGVQLFFVISATTMIINYDDNRELKDEWLQFLFRRTTRIFPLYVTGIIIYFLAAMAEEFVFRTESNYSSYTPINITLNILLINNLFASAQNVIVPGGWSISAEFIFYLIFPTIIFCIKAHQHAAIIIFFSSIFANIAFQLSYSQGGGHFLYYHILNQIPVFLLTILLAQHLNPPLICKITLTAARVLIAIPLAILAYALLDFSTTFGRMAPPLLCAAASISLLSALKENHFQNSIIEWLGRHSYSIYLTHFLCIFQFTPFLARIFDIPSTNWLAYTFIAATATIITSRITFVAIEIPATIFLRNCASRWLLAKGKS